MCLPKLLILTYKSVKMILELDLFPTILGKVIKIKPLRRKVWMEDIEKKSQILSVLFSDFPNAITNS